MSEWDHRYLLPVPTNRIPSCGGDAVLAAPSSCFFKINWGGRSKDLLLLQPPIAAASSVRMVDNRIKEIGQATICIAP